LHGVVFAIFVQALRFTAHSAVEDARERAGGDAAPRLGRAGSPQALTTSDVSHDLCDVAVGRGVSVLSLPSLEHWIIRFRG